MNKIRVLDQGFVSLLGVMGDDSTVVTSARVSYNKGIADNQEKDKRLISFLMNNDHETPFEHVTFQFHIKAPIFVTRQWMRHRNSSFNEISGRYVQVAEEFYIPSKFRKQVGKNYEYEDMSNEDCNELYTKVQNFYNQTYNFYQKLLKRGVAKEQARMVLPLGMYTQFYWTVNARSLMNFLRLRMDKHAQKEMQDFASALFVSFQAALPWTAEAFIKKYPHLVR